jgi:hypothetical protein
VKVPQTFGAIRMKKSSFFHVLICNSRATAEIQAGCGVEHFCGSRATKRSDQFAHFT